MSATCCGRLAIGLLLCSLGRPAGADLVYTADGRTLYGRLQNGTTPGTLTVDGDDGTSVTLAREEVSGIEFRPPALFGSHRKPPSVVLRNGDRLVGSLRQLWPPAVTREGAAVVVPPAWVAVVHARPGSATSAAGEHDVVELTNGDRMEGMVDGLHEGRLRVRTSLGALTIDPARVSGLTMARGDAPLAPAPGIQVLVETTDGERLTGEWRSLTPVDLRLKTAWAGELVVPVERALRLTVLNGRLVFLSDIRPVEVHETPYFELAHPFRIDLSQGGRPLRLGGHIYSRGLGVHARSALTYTLAGSFKSFNATIGIDSEVGNGGSVVFRVVGDEKPLFQSRVMRGGDASLPVTVDVSGVLLLRLEVEEADQGDVADHADWAEARLLK
jgi:hypothetical protein